MIWRRQSILLAIVVLAILYLSWYPGYYQRPTSWRVPWSAPVSRGDWVDAVVNILFYLPLGAALAQFWLRRLWVGTGAAFAISLSLSYLIETVQLALPGRVSSLRDTALNGVGGAMGAGLAAVLWRHAEVLPRRQPAPLALFWAVCWVFWLAFPFMPALRMWKVSQMLSAGSLEWPGLLTPVDLLVCGVSVMLVAGSGFGWLVAALWGAAAYGGLLPQHVFRWPNLAIAGAGLWWGSRAAGLPAGWGLLLAGWLLVRQLYPFEWMDTAGKWSPIPLAVSFGMPVSRAVPVLAGKLLLYSITFWALRSSRWSAHWPGGLVLAGLLAVIGLGEWLQRYLPGRQAETTDLLLMAMAAALTAVFSKGPQAVEESAR